MGGRPFVKLFGTVMLKTNNGLLHKENPSTHSSFGTVQRQVIAYACNARALTLLHGGVSLHGHTHNAHVNNLVVQLHHHVHHQPLAKESVVHYHRHVHRDITQHHYQNHKGIVHHPQLVKGAILQLHDHDVCRGLMQHHLRPHAHRGTMYHPHHAHTGIICNLRSLCASASQGNDDSTNRACDNVTGNGPQHRETLAARLHALCEANPDDLESTTALEALVNQITALDDPEDLLMGAACLQLATIYASENSPNVLKRLSYMHRAVKTYEPRGPSLMLATCLYMVAQVHITMGDFEKALSELEQSASVMKRIKVTPCDTYCVAFKHEVQSIMGEACDQFCNAVNLEVQTLFGTAKSHLGRHAEASAHYHKSIKIKQKLVQGGSPDLGAFYLEMAEALKGVKDYEAAKELCLKAIKIFSKCYGKGSWQEAKVRSLLSEVHVDLGNCEDSLTESELAKHIWKRFGELEEVTQLNLFSSNRILVNLKRWDEAMLRLEEVIQASASGSKSHTIALILAARVCALSNNEESAADYCKRALNALEHQQPCTQIAGNLVLLAVAYEEKKEYEQAALFCKKATEIFDQLSGRQVAATAAVLEGQTGRLLVHAGKIIEAIPHLESCLSRQNHIPGADLSYVHFYLGLAYPQVQRLKEASKHFEAAKIALSSSSEVDATLAVSIYSNLATTYSAPSRLDEAIECQMKADDLVEKNNVEDFTLEEVESRLDSYRKEVEVRKQGDRIF